MTLRRSFLYTWLAGSLLAAAPVLAAQKDKQPQLTPEQQAERAKFNPKAEASPFGGSVVEQAVAQVNDQIINTSDYDRAEQQLEQEARQQNWSQEELEAHKRDLLRDLIDQQLLLSRGKDLNITGETELVRRLDEIRKQNHLGSMEDLEKAAQSQGVSYEDFKQNIRNNIITQQVIRDEVGRHIQLTEAQLQQYYREHQDEFSQPESVRLSEILIPVKTGGDENANLAAAKAKADAIYGQLKGGADFAALARQESVGSTASQGGDLGEFRRGSLAKELEDATFSLEPGQFTQPIRTRQGYIILKATQHNPGGVRPFAEVRQQVEEAAFMSQMQPRLREYLAHLRQNAYIDVRPGYVDTAAVKNTSMPLYSAYAPPGKKKKVHFKRRRYAGRPRGRHAGETATETAAAGASGAPGATAGGTETGNATGGDVATGGPGTGGTGTGGDVATGGTGTGGTQTGAAATGSTPAPSSAGTAGKTKAVASSKATEKPGRKEKIRFGQAPREALPPAANSTPSADGTQVAANAASSSSEDISGQAEQQEPEGKRRFSDRARVHHSKVKPVTVDQVENRRADTAATSQEAADQAVQSAPLGLSGDTTKKQKKEHDKSGRKTRYSDEANRSKQAAPAAPAPSTPSPLATPESNPALGGGASAPASPAPENAAPENAAPPAGSAGDSNAAPPPGQPQP